MNKFSFLLLLLLFSTTIFGQRSEINLNQNWRFSILDHIGASHPDFDDSSWRILDLPHDYSAEGEYSPENTPQNAWLPVANCWYRRTVNYDKSWEGQRIYLWFDGAYMDSEVYINGSLAGQRPYGFISFYFDITDLMKTGENIISVRTKNERPPTARFYHGSSIYGDTKLIVTPQIHIPISGGLFYYVEDYSNQVATIKVKTEIVNKSHSAKMVSIRHSLFDRDNKIVSKDHTSPNLSPIQYTDTIVRTLKVNNPTLWSLDTPYLYTLKTEILSGDEVIDVINTTVGVRTIEYKTATGFYLNGENLKLQGVCEHMEMLPVGQAIPDDLWRKRILLLKEMGCNTIRTAHNPFPPKFYKLCDELGMMVVDEIFDGWRRKGANDYASRFFAEWWRKDVEDWVRRDRNHPSIVMWSIGNETGHTDIHNITGLIHQFDANTRPTSGGNVLKGTDISGFTGQGGMPGALEKFHQENPDRAIVLTEVPHTIHTRGFYRVPTWWRDKGGAVNEYEPYGTKQIFFDGLPRYRSSYDNCAVRINARTCWKRTKNTPWIIGEFRWTGYDCLGEAQFMGVEFPKRSYNSGVIDFAGFPKDHYYFYQSQWTKKPMVHILPHWTHPDLEKGTIIPVVAYSNCEEVELFLNGRSLGRQKVSDVLDFVWKVPYTPGVIVAKGYNRGVVCATMRHNTASEPISICLEVDKLFVPKADGSITYLNISARDKKGNFVPWICNNIYFHLDGETNVLGFENGNPIDGTRNKDLNRSLFYGLARGFFQNTIDDTPVIVTAGGILGDTLFSQRTKVSIDVASIALRGNLVYDKYDIYYTLDGSEPTLSSKRYKRSFEIEESMKIRAAVYRNNMKIFDLDENFKKGEVVPFIDPKLHTDEILKDRFTGPFDVEIVGEWTKGKTTYLFEKTGILYEFIRDGYFPKRIGQWWYDYPNDKFENPDDMGKGEIKWDKDSSTSLIQLNNDESIMKIKQNNETIIFNR